MTLATGTAGVIGNTTITNSPPLPVVNGTALAASGNAPQTPVRCAAQGAGNLQGRTVTQEPRGIWHVITQLFHSAVERLLQVLSFVHAVLFVNNDPNVERSFGHGIENWHNNCAFNSVIQALRYVQFIRNQITDLEHVPTSFTSVIEHQPTREEAIEFRKKIAFLVRTLENEPGRELTAAEMNEFVELCRLNGFARRENEQADAAELLEFVLNKCKLSPLRYQETLKAPAPYDTSNIPKSQKCYSFTLPLSCYSQNNGANAGGVLHIQDLLNYTYKEEITKDRFSPDKFAALNPNLQQQLTGAPQQVSVTRTIQLAHPVDILPIVLHRNASVNNDMVTVPQIEPTMSISIGDKFQRTTAEYRVKSIICYNGAAGKGGHYATFIPIYINDNQLLHYVNFDDRCVCIAHPHSPLGNTTVQGFINETSTIVLYERVRAPQNRQFAVPQLPARPPQMEIPRPPVRQPERVIPTVVRPQLPLENTLRSSNTDDSDGSKQPLVEARTDMLALYDFDDEHLLVRPQNIPTPNVRPLSLAGKGKPLSSLSSAARFSLNPAPKPV